jgi:hypothetical protein
MRRDPFGKNPRNEQEKHQDKEGNSRKPFHLKNRPQRP